MSPSDSTQPPKGKVLSASEVNEAILGLLQKSRRVRITGLEGQSGLSVGLSGDIEVNAYGNVGKYLGSFNNGAVIVIRGDCSDLAGDSMFGGGIIIEGNAGKDCGLKMSGGALVIKGNSGPSPGRGMTGGTVLIGGDVHGDVCQNMEGGTVIVAGSVKGNIGPFRKGGALMLAGSHDGTMIGSIEAPLTESDLSLIERYLKHYGIDASPKTFRKIVPRQDKKEPSGQGDILLRDPSKIGMYKYRNLILDELEVATTDIGSLDGNPKEGGGLIIGKGRSAVSASFDEPFFVDLNRYDGLSENIILGIATACTVKGWPVYLRGKVGNEMRELFSSHRAKTIYSLNNRREDNDLLMMKGATILNIPLFANDGERLPEISKGSDLVDMMAMLRELRAGPIIITMGSLSIQKDLETVLISGPDSIMITSNGSNETVNGKGIIHIDPGMVNQIIEANRFFKSMGARKNGVRLIISTNIRDPLDAIKLLCLGADAVCVQNLIFNQLKDGFGEITDWKDKDWSEISESVIYAIDRFKAGIKSLMNDLNIPDYSYLTPKCLVAQSYNAASVTGLPLAGYGSVLPMWMQ